MISGILICRDSTFIVGLTVGVYPLGRRPRSTGGIVRDIMSRRMILKRMMTLA